VGGFFSPSAGVKSNWSICFVADISTPPRQKQRTATAGAARPRNHRPSEIRLEMNGADEPTTAAPSDANIPRLKWNQAAFFMGASLPAIVGILRQGGWRVHPSRLVDCFIDLAFASANSCLKGLQNLIYGGRIKRIEMEQDPLVIIGHWRTGTTMLHELLALDPRHTAPTTYQCFAPTHFLLSERWVKGWSGFVLPPNRPFDNMTMGWDLPQEDEFALCNLGVPSPYATIAFPNRPPQSGEYFELETLSTRERERWMKTLRTFLKQVYFRRPGRLVLKSPPHTFRLPVLLDMFPDARFIHMVRDPVPVFMSTVRLWKHFYVTHGYQKPDFANIEEYVFTTFCRMHERLAATRARVPPGRLLDVRYEDLVTDTVGTMRRIYDQLELGDFEPAADAVATYVAGHADYRRNRYEPSTELQNEIRRRWKLYCQRYGYVVEGSNMG
jgi:hypothetical protein